MIKLSIPSLVMMYHRFNEKYFNNELPKDLEIKLSNTTKALGMTRATNVFGKYTPRSISISQKINWTEKLLETTIIHEMIHVWQAVTENNMSHGRSFKLKAMIVGQQHGITIERTIDIQTDKLEEKTLYVMLHSDTGRYLLLKPKNAEIVINYIKSNIDKYNRLYKVTSNIIAGQRVARNPFARYYFSNKNIVDEIVNKHIRIY